jgi:GH35 family endo-1,4-beta-xylanase
MTDYGTAAMSREEQDKVMSQAYWDFWNPDIQATIDQNIEKYRKADGAFTIKDLPEGTEVNVEQISHEFIFGAHIFNFDQLGSDKCNSRYKELYGTLFNSATIPFYWKTFEPVEGKPRFEGEYQDTAEYWNACSDPKNEPHWRRPASDPVVKFCESKGIRLHGHTLIWGNQGWHQPDWMTAKIPEEFRTEERYHRMSPSNYDMSTFYDKHTPSEVADMLPEYTRELNKKMAKRIKDAADRYGDRIHSWDIVNESATDFEQGRMIAGEDICLSHYALMPGDYDYCSLKLAESAFPASVKLNINDYIMRQCYPDQVNRLLERGCKIDIMGAQMHLFNPQKCRDIAEGGPEQNPEYVMECMDRLSQANLPIHLSEITITSPGDDLEAQAIQAVIARNYYRLWFSTKNMMGITWWNVVDDCGAPGESSVSGLFFRDMEPKLSYYALNDLIHNEWKTKTKVKANKDGVVRFRGFRGNYRLSWSATSGKEESTIVELN